MNFTPQYRAFFASAIAEQAIALLERDIAGALALATPPAARPAYPAFVSYKKALDNTPVNPPEAIVAVRSSAFSREDNNYREQVHRLMVRPFLADQDPQFAAQAAYDYIRAIDQVLTSATMADWASQLAIAHPTRAAGAQTPGLASIGGKVLDVWIESHDYGVLWSGPQGFGVMPTLTAVIEVVEV